MRDWLGHLLPGRPGRAASPDARPAEAAAARPSPVVRRVLMITHDPVLPSEGGTSLRRHFRWNDPERLAADYSRDVLECSHGYARYEVVRHIVVDGFPAKRDGFRYTPAGYLEAVRTGRFHRPEEVDYPALLTEFDIIAQVDAGALDEVWLFGAPEFGYWESTMAGPGAFWCNSEPIAGTGGCSRRFVVMGFSYERGVGEMLENLGHRAESILARVFEHETEAANLFRRFTRYDLANPGAAEVGSVHFAPNSARDYDWGNPRPVLSRCDSWLRFPDLRGDPRLVTCSEWGGGDVREHHRWWLSHLPHVRGGDPGISWNWWEYVIDPGLVRA